MLFSLLFSVFLLVENNVPVYLPANIFSFCYHCDFGVVYLLSHWNIYKPFSWIFFLKTCAGSFVCADMNYILSPCIFPKLAKAIPDNLKSCHPHNCTSEWQNNTPLLQITITCSYDVTHFMESALLYGCAKYIKEKWTMIMVYWLANPFIHGLLLLSIMLCVLWSDFLV